MYDPARVEKREEDLPVVVVYRVTYIGYHPHNWVQMRWCQAAIGTELLKRGMGYRRNDTSHHSLGIAVCELGNGSFVDQLMIGTPLPHKQ